MYIIPQIISSAMLSLDRIWDCITVRILQLNSLYIGAMARLNTIDESYGSNVDMMITLKPNEKKCLIELYQEIKKCD